MILITLGFVVVALTMFAQVSLPLSTHPAQRVLLVIVAMAGVALAVVGTSRLPL